MKRQQWKNSGKTLENTGMAADESQKQKWGDRWSKEWRQNSSFCVSNKISVILRIRSWNHNFRNTKFELFSEETLRKMVQDRMQYLLSKDHLRHKWRLQRSWISYPDYQDAQDKQQTQYQLTPRSKWKMLQNTWKFPNRNVQTCGFVYQNTNGPNHGPIWKIRSFLWSEICTVILWQDCYGKGNLRKSYWNMAGRKFQIGNVSLFIVKKGYSCVCMWKIFTYSNWQASHFRLSWQSWWLIFQTWRRKSSTMRLQLCLPASHSNTVDQCLERVVGSCLSRQGAQCAGAETELYVGSVSAHFWPHLLSGWLEN